MQPAGPFRIGVDLVLISRIHASMESEKWLERIYTVNELKLCETYPNKRKAEYLAGRFAAKEAVAKAAGVGIGAVIGLHDVETLRTENGTPVVKLTDQAKNYFVQELGILGDCQISISHSAGEAGGMGYAIAMVLLC